MHYQTKRSELRQREKTPFVRVKLPQKPVVRETKWHDSPSFLWPMFIVFCCFVGLAIAGRLLSIL